MFIQHFTVCVLVLNIWFCLQSAHQKIIRGFCCQNRMFTQGILCSTIYRDIQPDENFCSEILESKKRLKLDKNYTKTYVHLLFGLELIMDRRKVGINLH